ncbi:hypothetical protein AcV5_005907 [Taiwanofungus camphoratus]|nr:hypothetical protein AcV5_005907 [Antrodia cinnamomea]
MLVFAHLHDPTTAIHARAAVSKQINYSSSLKKYCLDSMLYPISLCRSISCPSHRSAERHWRTGQPAADDISWRRPGIPGQRNRRARSGTVSGRAFDNSYSISVL